MVILSSDEMVLPVLKYIDDGNEHRRLNIINMLSKHFSLTEDERKVLSKSGKMETSLTRKGFIEKTKKAYYKITTQGVEYLKQNNQEIHSPDMNAQRDKNQIDKNKETIISDESIEKIYQKMRQSLASDLLNEIKSNTPAFFEELVIDLLVAMGYGGSREDAEAVGRSGDGGIDGIINEDRLGLDVVYVQAKRWENKVGEPPIRDFVGALDGEGAQKGIFITTSDFSSSAKHFSERSTKKIVLINGTQLAQYMINHNVGVSTSKTYEIKKVDSDYFVEE